MSLCAYPSSPVFMRSADSPRPFLDDVFGHQFAKGFRSKFGQQPAEQPMHASGFSDADLPISSCGSDSYLDAAFSSVWTSLVILLVIAAGLCWRVRRRPAVWLLGSAFSLSLLDSGIRFFDIYARYPPEMRDILLGNLAPQMAANISFQFVLPFAAGLLSALLLGGLRRAFAHIR